jgi:hypothetical protein
MTRQIPTEFLFAESAASVEPADKRAQRLQRQAVWLEVVGARGWVKACAAAGVDEPTAYRWLRLYPEFAEAYRMTREETALRLERVLDGIATGDEEGTPTQMSALQFRLRGLRPEVYRERSSVSVDSTVRVAATGDGSRARVLLAEWTNGGQTVDKSDVDRLGTDCG